MIGTITNDGGRAGNIATLVVLASLLRALEDTFFRVVEMLFTYRQSQVRPDDLRDVANDATVIRGIGRAQALNDSISAL